MRVFLSFLFFIFSIGAYAQNIDSLKLDSIFTFELEEGQGHKNLKFLCKNFPHRLSGSTDLEEAVIWSKKLMESYDFDTVFLQKVMVPHWERGATESAVLSIGDMDIDLAVCALGGSIATPPDGIRARLVEVKSDEEWKEKGEKGQLKDKVVFVNIPMPARMVSAYQAYGHCWNVRGTSAITAAGYGAKAVLTRSLSQTINEFPHTGVMFYADSIEKIPAMAVSTADAEKISQLIREGEEPYIQMAQHCKSYEDAVSYNVIAEYRSKSPTKEYITIGGHLDCWDLGEGAHDDGGGIMQCLDALALLKKFYTPNRNIRCVFYTNEENGSRGAKKYAEEAKLQGEKHVYALESDGGSYVPRGIGVNVGEDGDMSKYEELIKLLRPYYMGRLERKGGGVDIGPLKDGGTILSNIIVDSQRYFDVHHCKNDVWENVNEREFKLSAAGIASWIYLIDAHGEF